MGFLEPTSVEAQRKELGKKHRHCLSVFRRVLSSYHEHCAARGNAGSIDYAKSSMRCSMGSGGIVRVTSSDFICDVETSARRGLTESELTFFHDVFINESVLAIDCMKSLYGSDRFNVVKKNIQIKLGRVFEERGVFPVFKYFMPVDVR